MVSANPKTFTDLNEAINGNNDNDVYLDGNYTFQLGTDDNFKNGVVVGRAVTVWGNGYTLDGANAARIFTVTSFNVVFHDINFINGSATYYDLDYGGAIKGQCKAINCNFANNQAYFGGAMHLGTAYNCTFYNNRATGEGGAIHDAVAYNCTFSYNQAKSGGGAIYWGLARNCTFSYNQARFGGAIYDATAYGCTFYNNIAKVVVEQYIRILHMIVLFTTTEHQVMVEQCMVMGIKQKIVSSPTILQIPEEQHTK